MLALIFECGSVTSSWYAELALRRRVKKSAIGSVIVICARSSSSLALCIVAGRASSAAPLHRCALHRRHRGHDSVGTFLTVVPGRGLPRPCSGLVCGLSLLPAALLHARQF